MKLIQNRYRPFFPLVFILLCINLSANGQDPYRNHIDFLDRYDFNERPVPSKPDPGQQIRVIIDADAKNEVDDQWAIALALFAQDRFKIEGFVAANFDNHHGGPSSYDF